MSHQNSRSSAPHDCSLWFGGDESGNVDGGIKIQDICLRPGEKLYEELLIDGEPELTIRPRIFKSHEDFLVWSLLQLEMEQMQIALITGDKKQC